MDVLILKALSWGPAHGYAVASWIERTTGDALRLEEARRTLPCTAWNGDAGSRRRGTSRENDRRAKRYALAEAGRRRLGQEASRRVGPRGAWFSDWIRGQSSGTYLHYRERNRVFEDLGLYYESFQVLTDTDSPERIRVSRRQRASSRHSV